MKYLSKWFAFCLFFAANSVYVNAQPAAKSVAQGVSLSAEKFSIDDYKGKVVYLDFWASWCIPCRQSFPWLNKMRAQYSADQLVIIAVNLDKSKALATEFLQNYPANFTILYDQEAYLAKKFQIPGMPSHILFDSNGAVVTADSGFFTKKIKDYEAELEQLITK